jgi:hypothetical protein
VQTLEDIQLELEALLLERDSLRETEAKIVRDHRYYNTPATKIAIVDIQHKLRAVKAKIRPLSVARAKAEDAVKVKYETETVHMRRIVQGLLAWKASLESTVKNPKTSVAEKVFSSNALATIQKIMATPI